MAGRTLAFVVGLAVSVRAALRDSSELKHSCFDFPAKNFHRGNSVKDAYGSSPHAAGGLEEGDEAFDFTLNDVEGNPVTLSTLVAEKPVLILWGMWTCPAFQGLGIDAPFDECSYKHEWKLVESMHKSVHVLHLVGPEPHPLAPDTNFDEGKLLMNYWSTTRQPKTYEARVANAAKVAELVHPAATVLVDGVSSDLSDASNNAAWCSMGLGARTATLIGTDGKVTFKQDWFHASDAITAIEKHFASQKVWTGLD